MKIGTFVRGFAAGTLLGVVLLSTRNCDVNKEKPTKEELKNSSITFETISKEELDRRVTKYLDQIDSQDQLDDFDGLENNSINFKR